MMPSRIVWLLKVASRPDGSVERQRLAAMPIETVLVVKRLVALGFHPDRHFWEMNHIRPVSEGGGSCGLDNLETLCLPCHRRHTKALRTRLAERKKRKGHGNDRRQKA